MSQQIEDSPHKRYSLAPINFNGIQLGLKDYDHVNFINKKLDYQEFSRSYNLQNSLLCESLKKIQRPNRFPEKDEWMQISVKYKQDQQQQQQLQQDHPQDQSKCFKGLRSLSEKVLQILSVRKCTTYKVVAQELVQEINKKESKKSNEEQNVRRRVYDALNVLVASGIILKDGKNIVSQTSQEFGRAACQAWDSVKKMRKKLQIQREKLKKRQNILWMNLARLNTINRLQTMKGQNQGGTQTFKSPLLFVSCSKAKDKSILQYKSGQNQRVRISSKEKIEVVGEIDLAQRLFNNQVELQQIPEENRQQIMNMFLAQ